MTQIAGHHPEREQLVADARDLAGRIVDCIATHRDARAVWAWAVAAASGGRHELVEPPLVGLAHRIGVVPSSWPYVPEATTLAYLLVREPGAFLGPRNRRAMDGFWTTEPYLVSSEGRAAKHEELVFVWRRGDRAQQRRPIGTMSDEPSTAFVGPSTGPVYAPPISLVPARHLTEPEVLRP